MTTALLPFAERTEMLRYALHGPRESLAMRNGQMLKATSLATRPPKRQKKDAEDRPGESLDILH